MSHEKGRIIPATNTFILASACIVALAIHLFVKQFDAAAIALILIGLSPWMAEILESITFGSSGIKFREQVNQNTADITTLKFLLSHLITTDQLTLLIKLHENRPYVQDTRNSLYYEGFKQNLLQLRGLKFIRNKKGLGFPQLEAEPKGDRDARQYFEVDEAGRGYLELLRNVYKQRGQLQSEDLMQLLSDLTRD